MRKIKVPLENQPYEILIGENLIQIFPSFLEGNLSRNFLAIVTDKHVEALHLSNLL